MEMEIPNRGPSITITTLFFLSLSWVVVATRYYVRVFITRNFFYDDALTGICLLLFTAYCAVGITGVHEGVGRHVYDLPPANIEAALKVWYICEIVWSFTACVLRVNVGLFLLRIVTAPIHRTIIIALNTIGVVYYTVLIAMTVFQCIPLSYFWERVSGKSTGTCFEPNVAVRVTIGATVVAAVIDWSFALLPIWFMWTVRLSKSKKIQVCFLFALGALASAAPIVRLPYLAGLMNNSDFLWATTGVAIWSVVELGVGIIVISLPSCRPLFRGVPFLNSTSAESSNPPSNTRSSRSKYSWPSRRITQKGTQERVDVESSNDDTLTGGGQTFLSDASVVDHEKGIGKSVHITHGYD